MHADPSPKLLWTPSEQRIAQSRLRCYGMKRRDEIFHPFKTGAAGDWIQRQSVRIRSRFVVVMFITLIGFIDVTEAIGILRR